jgi:hypothetical protein
MATKGPVTDYLRNEGARAEGFQVITFGMSLNDSLDLKALCTSLRYPSRATRDTSWR